MRSLSSRYWLLLAVAAVAVAAAVYVVWKPLRTAETPRFRTAKVERGPIVATVSATGTLNPVTSVQVGTQVSGQIKELYVDFNAPVKRGQLIARIDPETFEYRVRQAEADAEAARAALGRAQVNLANALRELERARELVGRNFVSPAELDARQAAADLARADVTSARALLAQREASLASARVDLGRTAIRAPVDGVVIKRSVDVGQTVAASLQAPELFVIARDLRDMQVETSIDEADVGRIRVGQRATFTVDAFPGRTFSGEVRQVRKSPQNVQNVVTYTVLVSASNESGQLMPGMTANVRIVTDTRDSVLKVANAALRFRPPGETAAADRRPAPGAVGEGSGDGGPGNALRERLVAELRLDAAQQAQLEPILADLRSRMAAAREQPEAARRGAMQAARADARARIEQILTAEQKPRFEAIAADLGGRAMQARGRIWVLADGRPTPIDVRTGLSDGTATEIEGPGVAEGLEVLVGTVAAPGTASQPARSAPPRLFF